MVIEYETISNKYNIIYNNKYNNKKVGEDQPQQGGGGGQTMLCVPPPKKNWINGGGLAIGMLYLTVSSGVFWIFLSYQSKATYHTKK